MSNFQNSVSPLASSGEFICIFANKGVQYCFFSLLQSLINNVRKLKSESCCIRFKTPHQENFGFAKEQKFRFSPKNAHESPAKA